MAPGGNFSDGTGAGRDRPSALSGVSHAVESGWRGTEGDRCLLPSAVQTTRDAFTPCSVVPPGVPRPGDSQSCIICRRASPDLQKGFSSHLQIRNCQMRQSESVFSDVGLPGASDSTAAQGLRLPPPPHAGTLFLQFVGLEASSLLHPTGRFS